MKKDASLIVALFMVIFFGIFSFTVTNMAAPYIVGDLGGSNDISHYTIAFFGLGAAWGIPLGRPLASRIGTVRALLISLLLAVLFSLLCGIAPNYPVFIGFRFLLGLSTGLFYPLAFPLLGIFIPKEKRVVADSITVTLFAVVPVLSACWGGWIAYDYLWRHFFIFDTGILLLLTAYLSFRLLGFNVKPEKKPFDGIGYFFFAIGVFFIGFGLATGQEFDWQRSPMIVSFLVAGSVSTLFFIFWSWNHPSPILHLHLFKNPVFAYAMVNLALLFSAYFGTIILLALWLTLYANYTPIWIGVLIGSMAAAGFMPSLLIGGKYKGIDSRIPLLIAIFFFAVSSFYTTTFDVEINFGRIAISRILARFGLAFFLPPLFRMSFNIFPFEKRGEVMEVFQVVRSIASGLGAALYPILWQRRQVFFHERLGEKITKTSELTRDFFIRAKGFRFQGLRADEQLGDFLDRRATSLALDDVFYFMAWMIVGLGVLMAFTFFLRKESFSPETNISDS